MKTISLSGDILETLFSLSDGHLSVRDTIPFIGSKT